MHYIQFFQRAATNPTRLIPACGDRAVIIVDGRTRETQWHGIAIAAQKTRGFDAYQVRRGDTFVRSKPVTGLFMGLDLLEEGCDAIPEDLA